MIEPFFHANVALAPNRNIDQEVNLKSFNGWKDFIQGYGRAALGFGLSL
jgi:hypothetical protein